MQRQVILDFDATCVYNDNPYIGEEVPDASRVIKRIQKAGHILILCTMRTDNLLDDALAWFKCRGIRIDYVNMNPMYETGSRKIYGHIVLDDKCCGIPLICDSTIHRKPFVDWVKTEKILEEKGLL
jgi:hypothetical protein